MQFNVSGVNSIAQIQNAMRNLPIWKCIKDLDIKAIQDYVYDLIHSQFTCPTEPAYEVNKLDFICLLELDDMVH